VIDFTSALYLGLAHESASLSRWASLTHGRPAALGEVDGSANAAGRIAKAVGLDRGAMYPSTLHLFFDVFTCWATSQVIIFCDEVLYPIMRWGVDRATAASVPTLVFRHHDPGDLRRLMEIHATHRRPIVVTDGVCTGCGRPAPIADYIQVARRSQGMLVVDDTQAFGILGERRNGTPLGTGGGGSLRFWGVSGRDIVWGASLAKAFGVPAAVLAASSGMLGTLLREGPSRFHASPANAAEVAATERALRINEQRGDALRARVASLAEQLQHGLAELDLAKFSLPMPFQSTRSLDEKVATDLHALLSNRGVRCLVQQPRCRRGVSLTFLVTVDHEARDIDRVLSILPKRRGAVWFSRRRSEPTIHSRQGGASHVERTNRRHTFRVPSGGRRW
jgi:8-amino-7-oxononanoate synthase